MPPRPTSREAGFTLAELLVSLFVTAILLLGVLALFDFNSRVARVQTHVADMQQSMRVAQYDLVRLVRMTGRGGLPASDPVAPAPRHLPAGVAAEVRDNVPSNTFMLATDPDDTRILEGTDVLTVRGVFTTPIYQLNTADPVSVTYEPNENNPETGQLVIRDPGPTGVPQQLADLKAAIEADPPRPEALLLVSPLDDSIYAVVELVHNGSSVVDGTATVNFRVRGSPLSDAMGLLSTRGAFPAPLRVAFVGILEEYRFYIREEHAVDDDLTSDLVPRLSRARFLPGTESVYGNEEANAAVDVADNILDFQVALGLDLDGDGLVEDTGAADDEWLFNHAEDMTNPGTWQVNPARLHYIRVSTLGKTDRRDPEYQAPPLATLENRVYDPSFNSRESRMYRRRTLQTIIDLRNLA